MRLRFLSRLLSVLVFAGGLAGPVHAASLAVQVSDSAGNALADAVVLVEAVDNRPSVKPMPMVDISQARRQFNPRVTVITVGTPVNFPNFDTVRHQVYSFSPVKTFELKLYAGIPSTPVVFDKPGIAVLGCSIHDQMSAWVVVVDTPWFGRSSAQGQARIENLPAGRYQLRAWHAGMAHGTPPISQSLDVATADLSSKVSLPVTAP
jgi:plastocyanin